ncbi:tetratricopeptide repeat protein [Flavobacteriaceae bacterium Ap0902]|nr:tetratricopeptide repeat protein [Flavobacteriaceae bacterium Ap0902]
MSKKKQEEKKYATEEVFESLENTAQQSEHFLEKNAKVLGIIFGVLVLGALAYFAYLKFVQEPKNINAQKEVVTADQMFNNDSMNLALNGSPGAYMGYNQIIEEYNGSDVANIAKFKSAIALYETGNYQEALDRIESFSAKEEMMKAMKSGIKGDILVQLGNKEKGLNAYTSAVNDTKLKVIQEIYAQKAAVLAYDLQNFDGGLKVINQYLNDHPEDDTNSEITKLKEMLTYASK